MSKPAWQIYYEEFHRHAARVPDQHFERVEAFSKAAHHAYRVTADHLSRNEHWGDDRTLVVTHAFGHTVKEWIERGRYDWDALREELRLREQALESDVSDEREPGG